MRNGLGLVVSCLSLGTTLAAAADLSGVVFHDRNGNGRVEPGESGVSAIVELFGNTDGGSPIDLTVPTAGDGTLFIGPADVFDGCYAVRVVPPPLYRVGHPRADCPGAALGHPVGTRRYGSPQNLLDRLREGSLLHIALGDSIAEPASGCTVIPRDNTDYVGWFGDRLTCLAPGAQTENDAIGGKESHDLLRPDNPCEPPNIPVFPLRDRCDTVFEVINRSADLVTISIGGNDWLGSEPADRSEPFDPAAVERSVRELLSARANLQEILAAIASELDRADVIVNTVYDNEGFGCSSSDFHNIWIPIWMQMLRDVTWAHGPRFSIAEIFPEYAHQDVNGGNCCGERDLVCLPGIDGIHPTKEGAEVHLEKVWEAAGGVNLGLRDGIGATSNPDLLFPLEELVTVRFPTVVDDLSGVATEPELALARDGLPAALPAGSGELVVSGFDAVPAGIVLTRAVVVVRYRTTAPPVPGDDADAHYFEASLDGGFAPPEFTVTGWNTVVPLVGAGATAPIPNAVPHTPTFREVRAIVTPNLPDDGRAVGAYDFRSVSWLDLETLAVRLRAVTRGMADPVEIEWDAAWVELYGYREPGGLNVYRSATPEAIVAPGNAVGTATTGPYDDALSPDSELYLQVDDGGGSPATIFLVKGPSSGETTLARLSW